MDFNLLSTVEDSFSIYAAMTIQNRAIVDARDCLKPAQRQCMYAQSLDKITYKKPFKKSNKSVASALDHFYCHGDQSCYSLLTRLAKCFAMRYPLEDFEGSYGTITSGDSEAASRYCVVGDTYIPTEKGLYRIKDLIPNSNLNSDNIIPKIKIKGYISDNTTNLIFNSGVQDTYKITLKNGMFITGTPNHPLLTLDEDFNFCWKTIEELKEGDKILVDLKNDLAIFGDNDNLLEAAALGAYISEGCYNVSGKHINVTNSDINMIEPFKLFCESFPRVNDNGKISEIHFRDSDNCYYYDCGKKSIMEWFEENDLNKKSCEKVLPQKVLNGTKRYQATFLKYLFEGDGCAHNGKFGITYSSISEELIHQLQILLAHNFGINSFISKQKKRKELKLSISGHGLKNFYEQIGFLSERKQNILKKQVKDFEDSYTTSSYYDFPEIKNYIAKKYYRRGLLSGGNKKNITNQKGLFKIKKVFSEEDYEKISNIYQNYCYVPIMKKEYVGRQIVYSPRINNNTHAYCSNGIISHNTEMRLGELGCLLYDQIDKDCISLWYDNYDNTEKFPSVVPSLGYYNICNGSMGIATSLATSIPQYNIKEVNEALIKLLYNPEISFDEIYCPPDFCTGATILNGDEVKESHRNGYGRAAIIRSTISYDENEHCLYVTEIPYGVYAGTICEQIKVAIENNEISGIANVLDLSTKKANIKILLEKNANINRVIKLLYKHTSLQNSYTINLTMLDKGAKPKVFTWKEALQAHLDHEKTCYKRIHEFEIKKIEARINIIDGLLIAIANIDEVVNIIRSSQKKSEAKEKLISRFGFNEPQVEAILKMALSKLIGLEIKSYKEEKDNLTIQKNNHQKILDTPELQKKEIADKLKEVAEKWGDDRRTQIINLEYKGTDDDAEPIEEKQLLIYYTNLGNLYTQESSTLLRTRRGTKGSKIKLAQNEVIEEVISDSNLGTLLAFTNKGQMYHIATSELPVNSKINIAQLFELSNEKITALTTVEKNNSNKYYTFITKQGMIKKTSAAEYNSRRGKSVKAINLKDDDEVVSVLFTNEENVGILTNNGNFVIIETNDVAPVGRAAQGIRAIKLNADDYVIDSKIVKNNDKFVVVVSRNGLIKKTLLSEYPVSNRNIKGKKISDIKESDRIEKFLTLNADCDIIIVSERKTIKISTSEIRELSRAAVGVKSISLEDGDYVKDLRGEASES